MYVTYRNLPYYVSRRTGVPFLELLEPSLLRPANHSAEREPGPGRWSRAFTRIGHRFAVRRTIAELSRLDDRTLQDIGLRRTEIDAAAAAAVAMRLASSRTLAA